MRIDTTEDGHGLELSEVFNGLCIKTDAGRFYLAQRDGGIEIRKDDGPWLRWVEGEEPVRL